MYLNNPFSEQTRLLYLYKYSCFDCGRSDMGLELHHIVGRSSNSPFNAFLICRACHEKCNHNREEEKKYFHINMQFLLDSGYKPTDDDYQFIRQNYKKFYE